MLLIKEKKNINLRHNTKVKQVNNFKYLGSWMNGIKQDIKYVTL